MSTDYQELKDRLDSLKQEFDEAQTHDSSVVVQTTPKLKLRKFSGERKELARWISNAERCISIQRLEDSRAVDYLMNNLEGQALIEVEYADWNQKKLPEDIFKILKRAFGEILPQSQLEELYDQRKQKIGENLRDFSYALMELLERLLLVDKNFVKDKDKALRDKFASKVRDVNLRRFLKDKIRHDDTLTFFEIREEAYLWQCEEDTKLLASEVGATHISEKDAKGLGAGNLQNQIADLLTLQRKQQKQLDLQQKMISDLVEAKTNSFKAREGDNSDRRCYYCHQSGHFKKDCPKWKPKPSYRSERQMGVYPVYNPTYPPYPWNFSTPQDQDYIQPVSTNPQNPPILTQPPVQPRQQGPVSFQGQRGRAPIQVNQPN